ncbi:RDD family protein [Prauserella cavernicola]|uniref:RDD family protein n=1 Tax=Prauserella cavernicola TaxID=2800127 RepID=A0A934QW62_9PSEU|nr:RDD family protein [Prauserella cavernicola]MBK1787501.1 RDD family protein [Prauserella cavernicola]
MTAVGIPGPPLPRTGSTREHVERALGPKIAKRLDTFEDGTYFISAGSWARLLSWFVDIVVYLVLVAVGLVALVVASPDASGETIGLTVLGLLVVVPPLYGVFFGNGRVLAAMLTGTRLVRLKDGSRIGLTAWWAMLVRTILFPLLIAVVALGSAVGVAGSLRRISIDEDATRQLQRLGVPTGLHTA